MIYGLQTTPATLPDLIDCAWRIAIASIVVNALCRAVFGGYPAILLTRWIAGRTAAMAQQYQRAAATCSAGAINSARPGEAAVTVTLTDQDRAAGCETARLLWRKLWWHEPLVYLLSCQFCQCFWVSLSIVIWAAPTVAHGVAAALMHATVAAIWLPGYEPASVLRSIRGAAGCKSCGSRGATDR